MRQFDFAPSPVKDIQLYTSCTVDPPVDFAIPVVKKATHTTNASLITIEKGELKLVREEIEEDEGMFEEFWEEVRNLNLITQFGENYIHRANFWALSNFYLFHRLVDPYSNRLISLRLSFFRNCWRDSTIIVKLSSSSERVG